MGCSNCAVETMVGDGEPMPWFEETLFLDGTTAAAVQEWILPLEKYLRVGLNALALITIQYAAVGPGAGAATLQFQRSSLPTDFDGAFQVLGTAIPLTRAAAFAELLVDATGGPFAHGLVRFKVNTGGGAGVDDWCAIRLRIWVTLQPA